jgi:hypothetical protein
LDDSTEGVARETKSGNIRRASACRELKMKPNKRKQNRDVYAERSDVIAEYVGMRPSFVIGMGKAAVTTADALM